MCAAFSMQMRFKHSNMFNNSFACWSLSFYPQPLLNYKRRSTDGLAVDFSLLNLLGFLSYTTSCAAFLYSPTIRAQYANRHPASPEPTVRFNDLAFAVHALFMCFVTYSQFFSKLWNFEVRMLQRSSRIVLGILWGCIIGVAVVIGVVRFYGDSEGYDPTSWAWIDTVSCFGLSSEIDGLRQGNCRSTLRAT